MVQVFTMQLSDLIIVLDKPLAGFSGDEKKSIFNNIVTLAKKHTVVLVDHGDTFYKVANNVIVLGEKGGNAGGKLINAKQYLLMQNEVDDFTPALVGTRTEIQLNSKLMMLKFSLKRMTNQ